MKNVKIVIELAASGDNIIFYVSLQDLQKLTTLESSWLCPQDSVTVDAGRYNIVGR